MIYFIQSGDTGPIKIGYTDEDVKKRLLSLQTAHYEKLNLLGTMTGTRTDEQFMHARFKQYRIMGEWFEASTEIINFLYPLPTCELYRTEEPKPIETPEPAEEINPFPLDLEAVLAQTERDFLERALSESGWVQSKGIICIY